MSDPFEPLEADQLRRDLQQRHASGTLMLVSLMQVAALALGVSHAVSLERGGPGLDSSDLLYVDIVLMCAVTTYFYYWQQVSVLFVPPTLAQLLIPFTAGAAEMVMALTFDKPRTFLVAYLVFMLASLFGFAYVLSKNEAGRYGASLAGARDLVAAECRKNACCLGGMALMTLAIYLVYPKGKSFWHDVAVVTANGIVYFWMLLTTEYRFLPALYRVAGVRPARS